MVTVSHIELYILFFVFIEKFLFHIVEFSDLVIYFFLFILSGISSWLFHSLLNMNMAVENAEVKFWFLILIFVKLSIPLVRVPKFGYRNAIKITSKSIVFLCIPFLKAILRDKIVDRPALIPVCSSV